MEACGGAAAMEGGAQAGFVLLWMRMKGSNLYE